MNGKRIVRRGAEDRREGKTDWSRLRRTTDEEAERAAAADVDNPGWTAAELEAARLVVPASETKVPVSIRLDREVLDYFRGQGRGYQSRINAVLRAYVRARTGRRGTGD